MADTMGSSYSGSDNTQSAHQNPTPSTSGSGISPDVIAAFDWIKRNPGIGLTHFKPENHRHHA